MTRYLLDTTTLIDFSKGREPVRSRVLAMIGSGEHLGVCGVNVAEFYAGVPEGERGVWDELFKQLTCWPIGQQEGRQAGAYQWRFNRLGRPLSLPDMLTAAVAKRREAVLLTDNLKDFPMNDIVTASLRN